ncbi:hypothetical protein FRC08_010770 [Ceratobasidium sp. 394]|nr:hypothetical protein FRC08_010770 [Ceratobasidium sp. 394]
MSRRLRATSGSLKPVAVRTTIYDTDSRNRLRSTGARSKKVGSSSTPIATNKGIVEALSVRSEEHIYEGLEEELPESEQQGWVDEELEDIPSTKKSPNRHLREWLDDHSESYVKLLFLRDAAPVGDNCSYCFGSCDGAFYQCRTCLASSPCCKPCLLSRHCQSPTHFIRKWNGELWENESLTTLGLVLNLGHGGLSCPLAEHTVSILVGDLHGFSTIRVSFCHCPRHPSRSSQLLAAGMMPCTDQLPQSAFTLTMLDHLSVFTTTGKCSGFKYWTVLKRLTNTGFPGKVADRYRELLQTLRKYNHLIQRKRCGVLYQPHPLERDPTDQALHCIACPRPAYNFHECEIKCAEDG